MALYNTLDEALQDIANRSFYESALVTPENGGYNVEDDFNTGIPDDTVMWTYAGGIESTFDDYSRLHESYETYNTAGHVRYNLSNAVEALEGGKPVTFAYLVVDAYCEDPEGEDCQEDHTAGWILAANISE